MSDDSSLLNELRTILSEVSRQSCVEMGEDEDLFAVGVLDSFGTIEFVLAIEKHFDCSIPQDMLIPQNLLSLRAITRTISLCIKQC